MAKDSQYFVENKGQWDSRAEFLSRTPNLDVWVTKQGLVLDYYKRTVKNHVSQREGHAIDMQFVGASPNTQVSGSNAARFVSQFFGPHAKLSDAKTAKSYTEARLNGLYPGVDMRVYLENKRPRYDIEVAPGASANNIKVMFKGASHLSVDKNGNLLIPSKLGKIQQEGLYAYQIVNGAKKRVDARFSVTGSNTVAFHLGAYDHSKKLIVDPLIYGSYYGGDGGLEEVRAVVADAHSGVYMTGLTASTDFPLKFGTYISLNGGSDSFLTEFQGDAYGIDYAGYFGGSGNDTGKFIALDPSGNSVWVAGMTNSTDFPLISGSSFQQTLVGATDVYLINFAKDPTSVLIPTYATYFHSTNGASGQELKGFAVSSITGNLFLAGETTGTGIPGSVNSYPVGSPQAGFVSSLSSTGQSVIYSRYVGGTAGVSVGFSGIMPNGLTSGTLLFWPIPNPPVTQQDPTSAETGNALAVDQSDEAFLAGTVVFQGNQDTSVVPNPAFPTTAGVFTNGRLLRNNDAFLTKLDPAGSVLFSTLIGGADNDAGTSVAVDRLGNAYVTGMAGSFDFPRTRGTFGQDFSVGRTYITKVSQDGSTIVYSTGLNTRGNVVTTGIAVDQRNYVFVTGEVFDLVQFPLPPGDPWEPSGATNNPGSIPTTSDAIRSAYTYPAPPEMSTADAWFMVLNDTATTEIYGTYIGGACDDYAYSPYTDRFGDCWVVGWTDSARIYSTFSSDGTTENDYNTSGGLDAGFITDLAFKVVGGSGGDFVDEHYGDYAENLLPFGASPATFGMFRARDGFVLRFRLDIPIVQSLVLNPSTIPGGLGATSTGTITLNIPATGAGVDVNVTLSDVSAASLDPSQPMGAEVVNIPAGATTATFTVYSNQVSDPSQVDVKAEYLGNFKVARLTVVPWLKKFTLSPSTVVGGNNVSGSITLADNAPAGGFDVTLLTSDGSVILFPGGNTVTIPAGQNFANFQIQTMGVDSQTDYTVSASALSVGITQTLTLMPASLQSVSFSPGRVAGGSNSTGTLRLDGLPGPSGFNVDLSVNGNPAGYSVSPQTLSFTAADRQLDFTVTTAPETVNTQKVITAHRAAQGTYTDQTKTGTLFIDANFLTNFTLNPTTVNAGQPSTGTVTISNTAETGGVVVNLSSDNTAVATVPATVVIPAGSTNGTFTVTTLATATDTVVHIHAIRGAADISRALTVKGVTFSLSASPTSVIGGASNITGTVTLALAAPPGGVQVDLSSSNPSAASVPLNVVVPQGSKVANFLITSHTVAATQTVTITGQTQPGTTATTQVQIRAISLASLVFNPTYVKGGTFTHVQVSLDAPAPAGGATVTLTSSNSSVLNPGPITIPAGQTQSAVITVPVGRVNRVLAVTITGQYNGRQIATTVTVHP